MRRCSARAASAPAQSGRLAARPPVRTPPRRLYATDAKPAAPAAPPAAAAAEATAAATGAATAPGRGPTPRRGRIKFPPEALEKIQRAHLLRETHKFWQRHFEEQRRAEAEQLVRYRTDLRAEREVRRSFRDAMRAQQRAEAEAAAAQLKADKERLQRSAAQMHAVEEKIRQEAKKEWLLAMNEDSDMWDKTPDELKNRRFVERRDLIYYTGRN